MKRTLLIVLGVLGLALVAFFVYKATRPPVQQKLFPVSLRLQWIPQSQFAGFIVAKEMGFYEDVGLDVSLLPAGPDLKPQVTVAAGSDDIGIGVPNHIITARANGVPLVAIAQIFQDSPNRYVLKSENQISDLSDLRGRKVGLWLGGDEAEFISMLATANMTLDDVQVVPQEFSVIPFLEDEYVLSQVTVYNELNLIRAQGLDGDKLQVLSPKDYDSAILGDLVLTTEEFLSQHHDKAVAFLTASLKGWRHCVDNPDAALEIVLAYNPDLTREDQALQLGASIELVTAGLAQTAGIGVLDAGAFATADRVLFESGQTTSRIEPSEAFDSSVWDEVPRMAK